MFKGKKVIVFDMDGTLIDSVGVWNKVDMELIKELGESEDLNEYDIRQQRDNKLREFNKSENPYIDYCLFLSSKYNINLTGEEILRKRFKIAQNYLKNEIDYKKCVPEFLKLLKEKKYTLIIASTMRRNSMDIYCKENTNIINKANINDFFSMVYTREDAKEIKPNPEIYLRIVNELQVRKEQILIFEDSLIGIESAYNAGIDVVAMYDKYSDMEREEIEKKATYNLKNYEEAIRILLKEHT